MIVGVECLAIRAISRHQAQLAGAAAPSATALQSEFFNEIGRKRAVVDRPTPRAQRRISFSRRATSLVILAA